PPSSLRAPAVFSDHRLQRFLVQTQIGHQLSQPRVLLPQLLGFLRLADIHSAVLRLPGVDRVLRHPHLARHILRLPSASSCFSAPIICASVCLLRDMRTPLSFATIILSFVRNLGEQVIFAVNRRLSTTVTTAFGEPSGCCRSRYRRRSRKSKDQRNHRRCLLRLIPSLLCSPRDNVPR